jgi:cardiolipin synthase
MVRAVRVGAILTVMTIVATARGGGLGDRELPANAVQPPGASFERHLTRGQTALFLRDTLRASAAAVVHEPVASAANVARRATERLAVRLVEAVPTCPIPPGHQCPEAGGPVTPARITPLFDSVPAYNALLGLIASARCRIDLMIYSWDDDEAGRAVADALIERARAGVLVRAMVDRGSFVTGADNAHVARGVPTYLDALRAEPNVRVIEAPDQFFQFDHRKVAVIDDRVVWTGGMVLTRPALERWHNFAFLAEGPVVPQYAALFAERWEELGGCRAPACPQAAGTPDVVPNAAVRMVRTDVSERSLKEAVYGAVDRARHHIYIENCYFSDQILVKKLIAARARGVDVRAVLTMRGDVRALNEFAGMMANRLLRAGAWVYLYPAMTHVKAMSVDGTWAYIGTGNFDELSLRNNREVGLTVRGPDLIHAIDANLFARDMADSEELHALLPHPRGRLGLELLSIWY